MTTTSIPNPLALAKKIEARRQVAQVEADTKAKLVRPGMIPTEVSVIHDGVVKTKHLEAGMTVRAFIKGAPRGGIRVIKSVTKIDDGAFWNVEFEADHHPTTEYKAAYRWYCEALDGASVTRTIRQPGFVDYQEV